MQDLVELTKKLLAQNTNSQATESLLVQKARGYLATATSKGPGAATRVLDPLPEPATPAEPVFIELTQDDFVWNGALKPRPYQIEGINYLRQYKRRWICDAPGLGKMLQTAYAAKLPALVVCPAYLCSLWHEWLVMHGKPEWKVSNANLGTRVLRQGALDEGADFTIINMEMLQRRKVAGQQEDGAIYNPMYQKYEPAKMLEFKFPEYATLIIDEAHHLRGHDSSQSKRALFLARKCEYVFLATATPSYNNALDLFSQFRLLDDKKFSSYWQFAKTYCSTLETPWGPKVVGVKPWAASGLRKLFSDFAIRRTYAEVGYQLPKLQETDIRIELSASVRARYDTLRKTFKDSLTGGIHDNLSGVLHALRKLTATSKLPSILELLTDSDALTGTIIFCEYKETVYALAELLKCPAVTGDISAEQRRLLIKDNELIVATIPSISEGVDASHLHTVVFFEESTVPGEMYQCISRVRRLGQQAEMVRVYYVFAGKTIDEVVHKVDMHKANDIRSIINEALA